MTNKKMQDDLIALAKVKAAQEELAREKADIEARLVEAFRANGIGSMSADIDGQTIKGTYVAPERTTIDAGGLEADLTPKQWEKVSTRVLDKEKLEAAVVQNIVDIKVVQSHSETKPTKPYVRVSGKMPDKELASGVSLNDGHVTILNTNGKVKPAARKRVAKPRAGK